MSVEGRKGLVHIAAHGHNLNRHFESTGIPPNRSNNLDYEGDTWNITRAISIGIGILLEPFDIENIVSRSDLRNISSIEKKKKKRRRRKTRKRESRRCR